MKTVLLLPIISAIFLPSCVTYDPDYAREAAQIQNVEYPANTIVGMWMQVGYDFVGDFTYEKRVYSQFNPDGTGVSRSVKILPAIYNKYKDLFDGPKDFSGEETIESYFNWKYVGKNKWEYVYYGNSRIVTRAPWIKTTLKPGSNRSVSIVRYHNGKLFFPQAHCTAVSMSNLGAAKAKLATIRALKESKIREGLEADRALLQYQKSLQNSGYSQPQQTVPPGYYMSPYGLMPLQGYPQGYNSGYGGTQYFR